MYRPQFAYGLPAAPCEDQPCMYSYDASNMPAFQVTLAAGASTGRLPLRLDKDADFYLRAITSEGPLSFRLEDTDGNALSDSENAVQSVNYELSAQYSDTSGAGFVTLESGPEDVYGPAGGNFVVYLFNSTAAGVDLKTVVFNLVGVKRYPSAVCK